MELKELLQIEKELLSKQIIKDIYRLVHNNYIQSKPVSEREDGFVVECYIKGVLQVLYNQGYSIRKEDNA
jgi:hypothetical protein